ncbi:hypothetical protein AOG1_22530 [Geobacter sp. AOG1]|nr:hypothetical protein AOG1_22530 [Geobacter sp. AOG1]
MNIGDNRKIWVDLDNSPHVPFFKPIIEELEKRNYTFIVTARDCFQVCGLADLLNIKYKPIGRHYGKNKVLKVIGTLIRAIQVLPTILREKPTIAVSHGSRTQQILASILRIPNIMMGDYEYATALPFLHPNWVFVPDVISDNAIPYRNSHICKYPGIKEDVYVPDFKPDPNIRGILGLNDDDIVVTIRPPASEAHYHNPESELLFNATIESMAARDEVRIVILPRNDKQEEIVRARWPELFSSGKIIIPEKVIDGLNLIYYSDLVISGGGTMNREAAALGIPVYSIFRGVIGAVDRYLAESGRLTLLESVEDVGTKIRLIRRDKGKENDITDRTTLLYVVCAIEKAIERK